jgi:hypothetical protein
VKSDPTSAFRWAALMLAAFVLIQPCGRAQSAPEPASSPTDTVTVRDLQEQVRQLRGMVDEMRAENAQSRSEMRQLRDDLQTTRALLQPTATPASSAPGAEDQVVATAAAPAPMESRVEKLEESSSLIGSKIDEQYQTKVETASKYRARLHGIILMNAFRNVGGANNFDVPDYSEVVPSFAPVATVGATLRQSEIGLEIFGPTVMGARTSADVSLDFAGGFAATGNGVNSGFVRLQTANIRFDWDHTSVVAGQDALFISPLSPTSFASLATPTFGLAGNLWAWTPQLRIEHRFSVADQQTITMQAGVFDNLDWEFPRDSFYRAAQAGELSGQPAYGFRTAWSRPVQERQFSFGVAGYYGRQNWLWGRYTDAWAGMADWQIPILPRLALSGELYRGRDIGGLGGGIATSIVYGGSPTNPFTPIHGVDAAGGWTQLKLQIAPKVELNGAISMDDAFTANIRGFATDQNNFGPILGRNRGSLGNVIFRPRSDLVLAAELRRFRTWQVYGVSSSTNQVNLSAGILF